MSGQKQKNTYDKFEELVYYIVAKYEGNGILETNLMKLLYFSDARSYESRNKLISENVTYFKNHFGPTPDKRVLNHVYDKLKNFIKEEKKKSDAGHDITVFKVVDKNFTYKMITEADIELVNSIISEYGKLRSGEISKLSHLDPPYLAAKPSQEIDFNMVAFRKNEEDSEIDLPKATQETIARDISSNSRKKLLEYARAAA